MKHKNLLIIAFMVLSLFIFTSCKTSTSQETVQMEKDATSQEKRIVEEEKTEGQTELETTKEQPSELKKGNEAEPKEEIKTEQENGQETKKDTTPERRFVVNPKNYMIKPVDEKSEDEKFVLLTFDDTPTAKSTNQILNILDKHQAKALFFVNGHYAEPQLELLKEIKNRGHLIGNHTWWHIYIRKESSQKIREEIIGLNDFLEEHLGERPTYFRPPFGQNSDTSLQIIKEEGMQTMNWSNGSLDWELKTSDAIVKQVLSNVKNGDNILFHDKQTTADALEEILTGLKDQGYQFVLPTEVVVPE
jgi:peptidoglycan/xylan/chitin deacetylase (PgdA/CDA1 family)